MNGITLPEAAKAVVRRNTEEVQGRGNFDVFEELFADDLTISLSTPQPGATPDRAGVRKLYTYIRAAFPDFHPEIHWQLADGDRLRNNIPCASKLRKPQYPRRIESTDSDKLPILIRPRRHDGLPR
jgi:hypothetical protein